MHKYQNLSMIFIFLYLFIYYLSTLIPLIECAQRKGNRIIPKTILYKYMCLFILLIFLTYTNFRALQILPPLTEISSPRFIRKGIQQVWFRILVSHWVLEIKVLFKFFLHSSQQTIWNIWILYVQPSIRSDEVRLWQVGVVARV